MQAIRWSSLAVQVAGSGHLLRNAERPATVFATGCRVIDTIMGYRPGDAERERSPAESFAGTRSMTLAVRCGIFPERVDRDRIFLPGTPNPARPDGGEESEGPAGIRGTSPAAGGNALMVCW
jgi:hypothetical protein